MTDQPVITTFLEGPPQEIKPVAPFTPDEAHGAFIASFPSVIIEEVNRRLRQGMYTPSGMAVIYRDELHRCLVERGLGLSDIDDSNWIHIEPLYRRYGWEVKFESDPISYWTFTRTPSTPTTLSAPAKINLNWDVTVRLTSVGEAELARFAPDSSGTALMARARQPDGSYKLPLYQLISIFGQVMPRHAGADTSPFETMFVINPTQ